MDNKKVYLTFLEITIFVVDIALVVLLSMSLLWFTLGAINLLCHTGWGFGGMSQSMTHHDRKGVGGTTNYDILQWQGWGSERPGYYGKVYAKNTYKGEGFSLEIQKLH